MKMKRFGILLFMMFMCITANAQMVGGFQQGNDGHIYFVANNQTWATFNIQIVAVSTDRNNSETKMITPNDGFYLGPTTPWRWYWKKGDKISVIYDNGQSQTWVCPQNDCAYSRSNVSFRGKHCSGSVGCSCSGFAPITDGDVHDESTCKRCYHKKSVHK